VGTEHDIDTTITITPVGMVVEFFTDLGHLRHKGEGLPEIVESKGTLQRTSMLINERPLIRYSCGLRSRPLNSFHETPLCV
jgi:hypothetical protein